MLQTSVPTRSELEANPFTDCKATAWLRVSSELKLDPASSFTTLHSVVKVARPKPLVCAGPRRPGAAASPGWEGKEGAGAPLAVKTRWSCSKHGGWAVLKCTGSAMEDAGEKGWLASTPNALSVVIAACWGGAAAHAPFVNTQEAKVCAAAHTARGTLAKNPIRPIKRNTLPAASYKPMPPLAAQPQRRLLLPSRS